MTTHRTETDSFGPIQVPTDALWGAQTQRSTQNFKIGSLPTLKLRADVFNVLDRQTGYNIQQVEFAANYGQPRSYFLPRRVQLSLRMDF